MDTPTQPGPPVVPLKGSIGVILGLDRGYIWFRVCDKPLKDLQKRAPNLRKAPLSKESWHTPRSPLGLLGRGKRIA